MKAIRVMNLCPTLESSGEEHGLRSLTAEVQARCHPPGQVTDLL